MVNLEKWLIYLSNCCGHVGESIQFDVPPPLVIYLVLNKHIKSLTKQHVRTWRLKVGEPRLQVKIEPKDK